MTIDCGYAKWVRRFLSCCIKYTWLSGLILRHDLFESGAVNIFEILLLHSTACLNILCSANHPQAGLYSPHLTHYYGVRVIE